MGKSRLLLGVEILLGACLLVLMIIPAMAWCPCGQDNPPRYWQQLKELSERYGNKKPDPAPSPTPQQTTPVQPAPQPETKPSETPAPELKPSETKPLPQPETVQPAPQSEPVQPTPAPAPAVTPDPEPSVTQPPVETPNSTPDPKQNPGVKPPDNKNAPKPPSPPPRPPAGTGLEPLVFNPIASVPMWENWWSRNRLYYLSFKKQIQWEDVPSSKPTDGTISVEMNANSVSKQALDTLIKCLKEDVSPFIRANAALALGKFKHKNAVAALKDAMLNDDTLDVKNIAALSLGIMGEESVVDNLKAILLNETNQRSQMISQAYAALALGFIKTEASINTLKDALNLNKKLHKEVQCSAVLSLGNLQDKSLVDFIGKILTNEAYDETVRSYAAIALGRVKDESILPCLKKAMNAREIPVRSGIAIALGLLASPKGKPELLTLLRDKSTEVQAFAAISLAQLGDNSVYNELIALTKKIDFNIEGIAFLSIGILGNKTALPELQKIAIKKTKPLSRGAAILALGLMKDSTSVNALIEIVKKEAFSDPISWNYAVLALGMLGDPKAVPALEEAFKKAQERIDLAVTGYNNLTVALAMLGKRQEVLDILYKQIQNKLTPVEIKTRALHGIGYIGEKNSIDHLVKFYNNEKNDDLRLYSVFALGFILDKSDINPLYKITGNMNFKIKMLIQDHIFFSKPD